MVAQARPRGLRLRHARPAPSWQQRRLLNHFISKAPDPDPASQPTPPFRFTLAVKDNIATTSASFSSPAQPAQQAHPHPTTCASPFLVNYHSPFEATIVTQLRARGARLVGKTNLDEFGMGSHSTHSVFGPVAQQRQGSRHGRDDGTSTTTHGGRNDADADAARKMPVGGEDGPLLSAGGSSGGSALAVARGEADVALGTDTGGSVRLPAAYCGVVGFKPSYGMLSRFGVVPYANSLDTVGLLARTVGDLARLVLGEGSEGSEDPEGGDGADGADGKRQKGLWREHDARDPTSLSERARRRCAASREGYDGAAGWRQQPPGEVLRGVRFGIPLEYNIEELDPRIRDAWAAAAAALQDGAGARVAPVSLPSTRHALAAYYVIAPAEASSNLAKYDGIRYGTRHGAKAAAAAAAATASDAASDASGGGVLYAATRGRGFGDEVQRRILLGSYTLSSAAMDNYFLQAQRVRRLVRRDFDRVFALDNPLLPEPRETFDLADLDDRLVALQDKRGPPQVDFLLCPTAPTLAPTLAQVVHQAPLDAYVNDVFTVPASLAGLPAISVPLPVEGGGTAGLQLIAQYWDDARLLAVAEAVSKTLQGVCHRGGE